MMNSSLGNERDHQKANDLTMVPVGDLSSPVSSVSQCADEGSNIITAPDLPIIEGHTDDENHDEGKSVVVGDLSSSASSYKQKSKSGGSKSSLKRRSSPSSRKSRHSSHSHHSRSRSNSLDDDNLALSDRSHRHRSARSRSSKMSDSERSEQDKLRSHRSSGRRPSAHRSRSPKKDYSSEKKRKGDSSRATKPGAFSESDNKSSGERRKERHNHAKESNKRGATPQKSSTASEKKASKPGAIPEKASRNAGERRKENSNSKASKPGAVPSNSRKNSGAQSKDRSNSKSSKPGAIPSDLMSARHRRKDDRAATSRREPELEIEAVTVDADDSTDDVRQMERMMRQQEIEELDQGLLNERAERETVEEERKRQQKRRNKQIHIAVVCAIILIAAGVGAYFALKKDEIVAQSPSNSPSIVEQIYDPPSSEDCIAVAQNRTTSAEREALDQYAFGLYVDVTLGTQAFEISDEQVFALQMAIQDKLVPLLLGCPSLNILALGDSLGGNRYVIANAFVHGLPVDDDCTETDFPGQCHRVFFDLSIFLKGPIQLSYITDLIFEVEDQLVDGYDDENLKPSLGLDFPFSAVRLEKVDLLSPTTSPSTMPSKLVFNSDTAMPSSTPTITQQLYDPPSSEDCIAVAQNRSTSAERAELDQFDFDLVMDVTLSTQDDINDNQVSELLKALQEKLAPSLLGCSSNGGGVFTRKLRSEGSSLLIQDIVSNQRHLTLGDNLGKNRFVIADAFVQGNPVEDVCTETRFAEQCHRVLVQLSVFLKGPIGVLAIYRLISEAKDDLIKQIDVDQNLVDSLGLKYPFFAVRVALITMPVHSSATPTVVPMDEFFPSSVPSLVPSSSPSKSLSEYPTLAPVSGPTPPPSPRPTVAPSDTPSLRPSSLSSFSPTRAPVAGPTLSPSTTPSTTPSAIPSTVSSVAPSATQSLQLSLLPSVSPTLVPVAGPALPPSIAPSTMPSAATSAAPSFIASEVPSSDPSFIPSMALSSNPSIEASMNPSSQPSTKPSLMTSVSPSVDVSQSPSIFDPCFQTNTELSTAVHNWFDSGLKASVESSYGPIGDWCFGVGVTSMANLFESRGTFNEDISNWDVSSITNMAKMFRFASSFNQDLSSWEVSSVTNMEFMFERAHQFNQNLPSWDVSSVTNMSGMFAYATVFNGDISSWDVSAVTRMGGSSRLYGMFAEAYAFNRPLSTWDVSNVVDMGGMFFKAKVFNQDLSSWDVSSVTNMASMFSDAYAFQSDLSSWNVSSVQSMSSFFHRASRINFNPASWDVSSVTDISRLFHRTSFNHNICSWGAILSPSVIIDEPFGNTMFGRSGCPVKSSANMSAVPPGPFCYECI